MFGVELTKKWFLVKDSEQNMQIATICADALNAIDQLFKEVQRWDKERIEQSIRGCGEFFNDLASAIRSSSVSPVFHEPKPHSTYDPFLYELAERIAREMKLRVSELIPKIGVIQKNLEEKRVSNDSREFIHITMLITREDALRECREVVAPIP